MSTFPVFGNLSCLFFFFFYSQPYFLLECVTSFIKVFFELWKKLNDMLSANMWRVSIPQACLVFLVAEQELKTKEPQAWPRLLNTHSTLKACSQTLIIWQRNSGCWGKNFNFHPIFPIAGGTLSIWSLPPRRTRLRAIPNLIIDPGGLEVENGTS